MLFLAPAACQRYVVGALSTTAIFGGWTGVNWRDSFLHHQENKRHPGEHGRAGELLVPAVWAVGWPAGFSEVWELQVGVPGDEGQGCWGPPLTRGEVWQEDLAAGSHQGWGWDRALSMGPAGKAGAQTERGNVILAPREGRGQVLSQSSWVSAAASAAWLCGICLKS